MFKKSLLAVAVLGTAAGFACAADVTLYGIVDTGLIFTDHQVKLDGNKTTDQSTFGLESGVSSASRFGLKGTEDLGNGLKVGFKLENGFKSDSGELSTAGRLFDREASVSLYGDFGTLSMGRMGGVASSAGTYDIVFATADAFDGGDNNVLGLTKSARYDNMITYQTPVFAGVQGTFQYSFKEDSTQKATTDVSAREGSAAANRYASAALTGSFGALNTVLAYEWQNYQSNDNVVQTRDEDGHTVYLGGNYDCGFAKTFVMAQYFKGMQDVNFGDDAIIDPINDEDGYKGYGLHLGTIVPVAGGDFTFGAYYVDATAEAKAADRDLEYLGLAAKYEYPLSKRTSVYTGAGYMKVKVDADANGANEGKEDLTQAYVGLTHRF